MSDFVGVLTIYTWVNAPEGRGKRLIIKKCHFCDTFEMGKDILNQWRKANPNIEMHAELVITRYID